MDERNWLSQIVFLEMFDREEAPAKPPGQNGGQSFEYLVKDVYHNRVGADGSLNFNDWDRDIVAHGLGPPGLCLDDLRGDSFEARPGQNGSQSFEELVKDVYHNRLGPDGSLNFNDWDRDIVAYGLGPPGLCLDDIDCHIVSNLPVSPDLKKDDLSFETHRKKLMLEEASGSFAADRKSEKKRTEKRPVQNERPKATGNLEEKLQESRKPRLSLGEEKRRKSRPRLEEPPVQNERRKEPPVQNERPKATENLEEKLQESRKLRPNQSEETSRESRLSLGNDVLWSRERMWDSRLTEETRRESRLSLGNDLLWSGEGMWDSLTEEISRASRLSRKKDRSREPRRSVRKDVLSSSEKEDPAAGRKV